MPLLTYPGRTFRGTEKDDICTAFLLRVLTAREHRATDVDMESRHLKNNHVAVLTPSEGRRRRRAELAV